MSENYGLDTDETVYFYEQDFYVLSNFSSFRLHYKNEDFDTSEHAYQWAKFNYTGHPEFKVLEAIRTAIIEARSAHEAYQIARRWAAHRNPNWDSIKLIVMKEILLKKVDQHEYVKRKLLATGNRELIENSWRDGFWGWGVDCTGENQLGKLWMIIRDELIEQQIKDAQRFEQNRKALLTQPSNKNKL